jgi:hypothetical protein
VVANHSASLAHLSAHGGIDNSCIAVEQNSVATEIDSENHAGRRILGVWSDLGAGLIALWVRANANVGFV